MNTGTTEQALNPTRFHLPSPGFSHYWEFGRGKGLRKHLTTIPDTQEIRQHIPLLFETDGIADAVVRELFIPLGFQKAHQLIDAALKHYPYFPEDTPECLQKLLKSAFQIPDWLDRKKVESGAAFCRRAGVAAFIVLRNYCLMGGYESSAINKPLIFTEALRKGAAKRIAETTEFWVNATGENALLPGNIGFKHAINIRLMYAFARVSVSAMPDWDQDAWGAPINHWDMLATNLGFSIVFLDGLNRLGIRPTKEEEEGLFHLWKYIGLLLGIPPEILLDNKTEAIAELYKWTMCQPPADADTQALAQSLMQEPFTSAFPTKNWQKRTAVSLHLAYNHFFLGRKSCEAMGLPTSQRRFFPYIVKGIRTIYELPARKSKVWRQFLEKRGRKKQLTVTRLILERPENATQK